MERLRDDFEKMQEHPRAARPRRLDRPDGHPRLHGPGAGVLLRRRPADGLRRALVGHPAGHRSRRTACRATPPTCWCRSCSRSGRAPCEPTRSTEPFTIGIRVSGRNAGDYRVSVSDEGLTYEPGEIESLPALHRVRRRQPGADGVRPGQLRHRARRPRPGRAVPEPVLPHLSAGRPAVRAGRRPASGSASYSSGRVAGGQPVLGDPRRSACAAGRRRLPEPRHLERRQPLGRSTPAARRSRALRPGVGDDERLDLVLGQLRRDADHGDLEHVGVRRDRLLDLGRREVLAAPAQHLLLAARRTCRCRPSFTVTRSPVCSQPSTIAAAVSSGISQ